MPPGIQRSTVIASDSRGLDAPGHTSSSADCEHSTSRPAVAHWFLPSVNGKRPRIEFANARSDLRAEMVSNTRIVKMPTGHQDGQGGADWASTLLIDNSSKANAIFA